MGRLFAMLLTLFGAYFAIQILFVFFGAGHEADYLVDNFKVNEVFESNSKTDADSYYINVSGEKESFSFQVFDDFFKATGILKKIEYYNDAEYTCILPIFMGEQVITDVMCKKNGLTIFYNDIVIKSDGLKSFYASIQNKNYDLIETTNNLDIKEIYESITLYKSNLVSTHYLGISNTVGYYKINSVDKVVKKIIFGREMINMKLKAFVGSYYIVADYTKIDTFQRFYVSNIVDNSSYSFSVSSVPFNSYIIGTDETSMYIYTNVEKKEFEIDAVNKNMVEIGNESTNINYYNGNEWERRPASEFVSNELKFNETNLNDYVNPSYYKILKKGNKNGYYYLLKRVNDVYEVYRAPIMNKEDLTYLFSTSNPDSLKFIDGYIYYTFSTELKYYNDKTGNRTVLVNPDFVNVSNTIYTVYRKK